MTYLKINIFLNIKKKFVFVVVAIIYKSNVSYQFS